jgi:hypothetical protein
LKNVDKLLADLDKQACTPKIQNIMHFLFLVNSNNNLNLSYRACYINTL